jgi:hypothetical protein
MAKYYVESGELQLVIHANSSRGAALWAVHRSLAQVFPFVGDEPAADGDPPPTALARPTRLAENVTVHQQGFGRSDGRRFDTLALVSQWTQLMTALDRVQDALEPAAGAA